MAVLEKKADKYYKNIGINVISTLGVSCNSKLRVGVRHWTPSVWMQDKVSVSQEREDRLTWALGSPRASATEYTWTEDNWNVLIGTKDS